LAYDIALACRNDPLLEPLSRVDMDWLLALLGRPPEAPIAIERTRAPEPVRRTEMIEGPPAASTITNPAKPSYVSPPARHESSSILTPPAIGIPPAQPENAPATGIPTQGGEPPRRERPPEPSEARHREGRSRAPQQDMFEQRDRSRDAQPPRSPDRPTPAAAPTAPNQPPKRPASARSSTVPPAHPANTSPSSAKPPERSSRSPTPPAQPELAAQPIDDDGPPDANALIERLRRQRQQREAEQSANQRASQPQHANEDSEVEQRFAAGDAVFCLPYGDGVVRASRIEDGQELLTVTFPAYGDLTIDPAKSLVRKLDTAAPDEDDLL
jgi:hypothetical protein